MNWMSLRRAIIFREIVNYHFHPKNRSLSSSILRSVHNRTEATRDSKNESSSSNYNHNLHHLPLFSKVCDQPHDYKLDIVDDETWEISTGFADAMKDATSPSQVTNSSHAQMVNHAPQNQNDPDFDEIDDLRICGNLFYKLDKSSKEYEEYNFDFHRRKSSKRKGDSISKETPSSRLENVSNRQDEITESKKKGNQLSKFHKLDKLEGSLMGNKHKQKERVPTFNQLTAAYHEPFCLDIYISKASVRACIVHRATSNVVVVAHSISKDMKFDLDSTRNVAACAAVGKVLAQRALADDIHNVIYTPRKGEKLEGKLQSVLQSLISNGVWVKVKVKKTKARKPGFQSADYKF
ncbi:uncharacterized protein LOC111888689 [Lactuca sativa]|uniref:Uncharacterized protein n=1 Tax=Lactuca sativa TaxID=4236 RepID=A0A9R1XQ23_LACSA|nr:uncharacterized protein LOC111888689 [Lactuca sativa]KAJ0221109.1 hypothetical protein LSAT_V11C200062180 [Lactuca sativa]